MRQLYRPCVLPLNGVTGFSTGQDALAAGGEATRFFYIYFDGLPGRALMSFHDIQNRDRALSMLRSQRAGTL